MNTSETRRLVDENNVVTLVADMTEEQPDILRLLNELGNSSGQIPYYAIYPAGKPAEPIVFGELITQGKVIAELQRAGPSKPLNLAVALPELSKSASVQVP